MIVGATPPRRRWVRLTEGTAVDGARYVTLRRQEALHVGDCGLHRRLGVGARRPGAFGGDQTERPAPARARGAGGAGVRRLVPRRLRYADAVVRLSQSNLRAGNRSPD